LTCREEFPREEDRMNELLFVEVARKVQEFAFWFQQVKALAIYQLQVQKLVLNLRAY
jgi:hypothetical protein